MVHWGETEVHDQLGKIKTVAEEGDCSRDEQLSSSRSITPKPEHKFQAGRLALQTLFDSKIKPTLLLCPIAKSVLDLWKEKAKDEKSEDKLRGRPKECQTAHNWNGIVNSGKQDDSYCKRCRLKIEPIRKRSRSLE